MEPTPEECLATALQQKREAADLRAETERVVASLGTHLKNLEASNDPA